MPTLYDPSDTIPALVVADNVRFFFTWDELVIIRHADVSDPGSYAIRR